MNKEKGFKSRLGFILASVGSAVGLGNLWAFPYKAGKNGGAVFVLVYVIMALVIGVIALISEIYVGKRTGKNVIDSYRAVNKHMGFMGILSLVCTVVITSYYVVLGGWVFKYAWAYLADPNFNALAGQVATNPNVYVDYFGNFSGSAWPILFTGIFFALALLVLIFGVQKGIEKVSKFLMPLLFALMVGLMIWSLCLPSGGEGHSVLDGLKFYFVPRADSFSSQTVLSAMGQSFFSLSIGVGIMCVYGSYAKEQKGIGKSALIVVVLDTLVALLAGMIIFPAIYALGGGAADVKAGPSLFFIVLPKIFANMGGAGRFFGFLFFFLVFIAAITSVISLVEVPLQTVIEKTKIKRPVAVAIFGVVIFALSILVALSVGFLPGLQLPKLNGGDDASLIDFFDMIISNFMMPIGAMAACIMVGYLISKKEVDEEFSDFKGRHVWIFFARYITPVLIGIVLITSGLLVMEPGKPVKLIDWRILVTVIVAMIAFVAVNEIIIAVNKKKNPQMALSKSAASGFTTTEVVSENVDANEDTKVEDPNSEDPNESLANDAKVEDPNSEDPNDSLANDIKVEDPNSLESKKEVIEGTKVEDQENADPVENTKVKDQD